MNDSKRQIKTGAILSYVSIILNVGAGLLYTPWMVKSIGQSQYGLYTLAYSLISLFLVDFGLSSATARYVSKYHSEGDEQRVNNFLGIIYKLYLLIDVVIFIALLIMFFWLDKVYANLTPQELKQFKVVYVIAGVFSVINFPFVTLNGILTAYEEFIHQKLADVFYRVLLVGIMILFLIMGKGLYALVAVNAVVGIIVVIYKLLVIKLKIPLVVNFRYSDRKLYKELFGFSAWSTISGLAQRLVFSITPTVLGVVSDSAAIAVFGIISTIESYVFTFTTAINGMFMPAISRAYNGNNAEQELFPLFLVVGKFQYAVNGLIVAGFSVIGQQFIGLWIGEGYSIAYYGILMTIIPGLFYNSLQIANTALIVTNRVNYQAYVSIITGIINIVLSFILSAKYGVIGACISIFIAFMARNLILHIIFYKVLKLDIPYFIKQCYIRMSIPILLTILCGKAVNMLIIPQGWIDMGIRGGILVVAFGAMLYYCGLSSEDKYLMKCHIKGCR